MDKVEEVFGPHDLVVVGRWVVFGDIVNKVLVAGFPVDMELFLLDSTSRTAC